MSATVTAARARSRNAAERKWQREEKRRAKELAWLEANAMQLHLHHERKQALMVFDPETNAFYSRPRS